MVTKKKKMTITLDAQVYDGLQKVIGPRKISPFLNALARPYVVKKELEASYRQMAKDEKREKNALEWSENLIQDIP